MKQIHIFYPMTALVFWTLLVLFMIPYRRFCALFAHRLKKQDFEAGESQNVTSF